MIKHRDIHIQNHGEQGFILIASILLLAILTLVSTAAWFKTNTQLQLSATVAQSAQSLAAAKAGLETTYAYWSFDPAGQDEFEALISDISTDAYTSDIYLDLLTPVSMEDLNTLAITTYAKADINDLVATTIPGIRVYNILSDSVVATANADWGSDVYTQVAVWSTSYTDQIGSAYPYTASNTAACIDCGIVTYALGRSRETLSLMREFQGVVAPALLEGVSAVSNSPAYRDWQDMCDGNRTGTGSAATGTTDAGSAVAWNITTKADKDDMLFEVTQAEYDSISFPSGVALVSNTNIGDDGKNFREGVNSTTVLTFDSLPMLAYTGHGLDSADNIVRVDPLNTIMDGSDPAVNMPATPRKLPKHLIMAPLLDTADEATFFPAGNPNGHLFDLDAYRWGAEQFTYQGPGNVGNGKYATKAEDLRIAMGVNAPVTGRINIAEFEYNLANSIPMFGVTRVMYPLTKGPSLGTCAALGGAEVFSYDTAGSTATLADSGTYDGTITTPDSDGELGSSAKLIAYGSIFFDFFTDTDNDGFFDPATERLINAFEAADSRMELEVSDYVNPALPEITAPLDFYSGTGFLIARGSSLQPVNLASPTGGWFPITELRIPATSIDSQGQMQAANALVEAARQMMDGSDTTLPSDKILETSTAPAIYATYKTRLDYYYQLMIATAKQTDDNAWPIEPAVLPAAITDDICIGVEDCAVGNNEGDSFHVLFPSGYHHGWKVSLAALNLTAADWNSMFSNLEVLAANLDNSGTAYDYGSADRPKGSPFNTTGTGAFAISDGGFARAIDVSDLKAKQSNYYHVTAHSSGYALLDSEFMDIPGQIYAGGIIDMHKYNNMSGVIYTPGPLEWETGHFPGATGYANAAIIAGFGMYIETDGSTKVIMVYDNQAVDNIPTTEGERTVLRRHARQELK